MLTAQAKVDHCKPQSKKLKIIISHNTAINLLCFVIYHFNKIESYMYKTMILLTVPYLLTGQKIKLPSHIRH